MAQITGEITATLAGTTYQLCLGMRGIAKLQQEYGQQLDPITKLDPETEELPDFGVMLRIMELALERHHPDADAWIADDLIRQDAAVVFRLIEAAFPSAEDGDAAEKPAGKKRKARA